jgi:hypothetical protein
MKKDRGGGGMMNTRLDWLRLAREEAGADNKIPDLSMLNRTAFLPGDMP